MPYKDPEKRRKWWAAHKGNYPADRHANRITRADERAEYVTVDGEGLDNSYVYLADSDGRAIGPVRSGLSTDACLGFLADLGTRPQPAIVVGYSLGYDVENWIADLKRPLLASLDEHPDKWTRYGDFLLKYWPRKRFQIKRLSDGAYVHIDDVFSFFNVSFETVVTRWLGADAPSPILAEGKARRGRFTWADYESGWVQRYNAEELRLLVGVMKRFNAAKRAVGIRTSDHYSPAALSRDMLVRWGVRDHIADLPPAVEGPAYAAFFGGRIECAAYGTHRGTVHNYDLNSAYPRMASLLPDLANGTWVRDPDYPNPNVSLYKVRWNLPRGRRFYPFPWRDSNGAVYFPPRGTGWVWGPELDAALEAGGFPESRIRVLDGFHFIEQPRDPLQPVRPFAGVIDLYTERLKRAGQPEEKVLKLVLSAIYGKLAQQTSATRKKPRYHQIAYAGLITSQVRALLYRLIRSNEPAIISVATDGVFSTEALAVPPNLIGGYLGQFKEARYDEMVSLQSGVYRLRSGPDWESYGRGFGERDLPWAEIAAAWSEGRGEIAYTLKKRRFVGHRLAARTNPADWRKWVPVSKTIHLRAVGKRYDPPGSRSRDPSRELVWTLPEWVGFEPVRESSPNVPDFARAPVQLGDTMEDTLAFPGEEAYAKANVLGSE